MRLNNSMKNQAPFDWSCHSCRLSNAGNLERCARCGCPSHATAWQIDNYRDGALLAAPKANAHRFAEHWLEFTLLFIFLSLLCLVLFVPNLRALISSSSAGLLGDFIGGFVGTVFTIASVLLLLSNLRSQLRASAQQNFENKYFELVKMHRENVAEFEVGDHIGRKVFVSLIREWQGILYAVRGIQGSDKLTKDDLLCVSYYALFYGVGPNSTRMLRRSLITKFGKDYVDALTDFLDNDETKFAIKRNADLSYEPLDGHQSRLGHYYRHLFQAISYVDSQPNFIKKYDYVKTIRAQLTNYEQAMLMVNSLTPLGKNWWDKGFIEKYRMVKNIPQDFFNKRTELDISRFFDGENDFEWQEHQFEAWPQRGRADTEPVLARTESLFD